MRVENPTELYPYANGPLLDKRNEYTYTPYHGAPFLDAWRIVRARARALCDLSATPDVIDGQILDKWAFPAKSADILVTLRQRMKKAPLSQEDDYVLDRLIQRFEVTKRVHTSYGTDWRAVNDSDFRDLGLVVLFAEIVADRQLQAPRLDLLNVLLKAMDTLCAHVELLPSQQQARLALLIDRESTFVSELEATVSAR